jgi:hypothetical protein
LFADFFVPVSVGSCRKCSTLVVYPIEYNMQVRVTRIVVADDKVLFILPTEALNTVVGHTSNCQPNTKCASV